MAWKSRNPKAYHGWKISSTSTSGDDGQHSHGWDNKRKPQQQFASSSEEALWRLSKRLCSAWRWANLDMSLLAQKHMYIDTFSALEATIVSLGRKLIPDFGVSPISPEVVQMSEAVELIGVLSTLPRVDVDDKRHCQATSANSGLNCRVNLQHVSVQATKLHGTRSQAVQASEDFFVRKSEEDLIGHWVPLDTASIRRGSIMRGVREASTNNASGYNLNLARGGYAKALSVDADGDAQIVALLELGIQNLWYPSQRFWLLKDMFTSFETLVPATAGPLEEMQARKARREDCDQEESV